MSAVSPRVTITAYAVYVTRISYGRVCDYNALSPHMYRNDFVREEAWIGVT